MKNLINQFWKQWSNEYLAALCEIHKYYRKRNLSPDSLLNNFVIIKDKNLPQASWKFRKLEILVKSKEGKVHGAYVRTSGCMILVKPAN